VNNKNITGGCQCGAVRFRVVGELGKASICHCRMCQKAFGGFFGPLVSVENSGVEWTRGRPSHYASSNFVRRGFCKNCGTPLTFEHGKDGIEIAIGTFDDPGEVTPVSQLAHDAALPFFDKLPNLHKRDISDGVANKNSDEKLVSYQHPDHDTDNWPPSALKEKQ
jgi:hypothetical protein